MLCFCSAVSDSGAQNRVFSSAFVGIGIVGDLDLDHPVDVVGVAVGRLGALLDGRDELVLVQLLALAGRADETVARAAGVLGHLRPARGDVDRDTAVGNVVDRCALGLVVLALEVDPVPEPQFAHQLDRLAQARVALLELGPVALVPGGDLVERLARADAEEDPVRVQAPHGREGLGDDGGVVAERRCQHGCAEDKALGALAHRGHPRQRERRVATLVAPRLEVVADGGAVHAVLFGGDAELDEFSRGELLRRRLVSEFQFRHCLISTLPT